MSTHPQSKARETPDFTQLSPEEHRVVAVWKEVSCIVHRLRLSDVPTSSNGMLREYIRLEEKGVLSPLFQLWIGDNYQFAGQLPEAIEAYRELAERFGERKFCGQALGALGLEQAANCHERLGQTVEAMSTLKEVLGRFSNAYYPGWVWYRIGQIAERAGNYEQAINAFRTAADTLDAPNGPTRNYRDLARRGADRLERDRDWMRPSSERLIVELTKALQTRDLHALRRLASPTHFTVGMMWSEGCFVESEQVLEFLTGDLSTEGLSFPQGFHSTTNDKIYLPTDGWQGRFLSGSVMFQVTAGPGGYEWSGVVLTRQPPPGGGLDFWSPLQPEDDPKAPGNLPGDHREPEHREPDDQPPITPVMGVTVNDLMLKCPWPRGTDFYAGGLIKLGAELAVFDIPIVANTASLVPVVGPLLTGLLYGVAAAAAPIVAIRFAIDFGTNFPCGLGAGGLYYGQAPTHTGTSNFAVDFATFNKVLLPIGSTAAAVYIANNATLGQPVLSVQAGVVIPPLISGTPTGGTAIANEVRVALAATQQEKNAIAAAFFIALFTGKMPNYQLRYSARYMHMDGPGLIPVSLGMYVQQGTRLGVMDDTGLSQAHHLHFELRDSSTGRSVRPTPMDGQTLNDSDDGRCMHSTNVPIP